MRLNAALDLRVLAFTAGVSVLSSFLFGLAPAFRATRIRAGLTVTSTARPSQLPGHVLVVLQIAVSVLLVTGAGLFVRTLQNLRTQDLGFRPQGLLQVRIGPWPAGYKAEQLAALQERLLASVRSIPGVLSASMTTNGFSSGISRTCCIAIEGYTFHTGEDRQVRNLGVTPNYFETVHLPILLGRPFSGQDSHVAIINSSMARRYYGAASPIGQRFGWGDPPKVKYDTEIIGVVEDASIGNLREEARPLIYMPAAGGNSIQVRTWLQASVMAPSIREAIRRVDQNLTNDTRSIAEIVDRALVTEKLMARLGSFFSVLAIVLAGVGLYGLTNYSVVCRTREIGIRMALGATQMEVIGMVGRQVATLVICGLAVGVPASLASERLLRGLLFGVSSHDPEVLLVLPILIAVAVLAAVRPSHRAAAVDPVNALRDE